MADGTRNMTVGSPAGHLIRFVLPLLAGSFLQQLYNMVDSFVVGRYVGDAALAAVGVGFPVLFMFTSLFTGLANGGTVVIAQLYGAGELQRVRDAVDTIYTAFLLSVLPVTLAAVALVKPLLVVLRVDASVWQDAWLYLTVVCAGLIGTIGYNLNAGILGGLGNSRSTLLFLSIAAVLNIILDLVFLVGMQSGVAGAGYATVISQGISGILCLIYLYKKFHIMRFQHGECKPELKRCGRLLSIGLPMALQFSITAIGSIILQTSVNSLGSLAVTSVTAAQKICAIVMGPLESLGITMATFCGQNLGAKKFYRIRDGIRLSMYVSMCYCAFCIAFLWILGKYTAYLFLDPSETEVIRLAVQYMRWNAVFYPVLGVLFILRNSLQGMGYSLMPMMAGVSELAARSLVCFGFVPTFGYMAAIMASPVAWIFADVLLITVYFVDMRKLKRRLVPAEAAMAA